MKSEYEDSILYLIAIILLALPSITPLSVPIEVSPETIEYYDVIENLPQDAVVYMESYSGVRDWFDTGQPAVATLKHLIRKVKEGQVKGIVIGTLGVEGPVVLPEVLKIMSESNIAQELEYGTEWAFMGWVPGFEAAMASMLEDFKGTIVADNFGTPLDDIPLLDGIEDLEDFDCVIVTLYGSLEIYVRQWSGRDPTFLLICWMGHKSGAMPYYQSGQITAILTHVKQTAEYEKMLGYKGMSTALATSQLIMQFFLIAIIIIATARYWIGRRNEAE